MILREAKVDDIPRIRWIRNHVTENVLSDSTRITEADYEEFILQRGKGWVCETDGSIAGFAVADLKDHNIWALFVDPGCERRGIGRLLHDVMLKWYFCQTSHTVWLSTGAGTRAEKFYRKAGWKETGMYGHSEIRFEMTFEAWSSIAQKNQQ